MSRRNSSLQEVVVYRKRDQMENYPVGVIGL